jgi:hypothetical protein
LGGSIGGLAVSIEGLDNGVSGLGVWFCLLDASSLCSVFLLGIAIATIADVMANMRIATIATVRILVLVFMLYTFPVRYRFAIGILRLCDCQDTATVTEILKKKKMLSEHFSP